MSNEKNDRGRPGVGKRSATGKRPGGWRPHGKPFRGPPRSEREADPVHDDAGKTLLFGNHAVEAALANSNRVVHQLWLTENSENRLTDLVKDRGFTINRVTPRDLDRRLGNDTVHQGVLMETEPLDELPLSVLARRAAGKPLVVLDQVTDPHNVGAVLRSAAVFGTAGVVMTRRHSPPLTGVLAKAASGALELVPVTTVQNLARGLDELKTLGCTLIGLDGEASEALDDIAWPSQPVLVLGAEGKGLRQLTRETCDRVCKISTDGQLASLNVSNAAAVALHLAYLGRKRA